MLPDHVSARVEPDPVSGCWMWTGALTKGGYGNLHSAGRTVYAHRYTYELLVGPIPDGLQIDHLCRNRACVNPAHLEPKTARANLLAPGSMAPAAVNAAKTHCPQGHAYTTANTYRRGGRRCRACILRSNAERRRRRKAA